MPINREWVDRSAKTKGEAAVSRASDHAEFWDIALLRGGKIPDDDRRRAYVAHMQAALEHERAATDNAVEERMHAHDPELMGRYGAAKDAHYEKASRHEVKARTHLGVLPEVPRDDWGRFTTK